ncbi:MAG: hypothetical protein HWQ35_32725 [Nostoc sp. NMS1]|uniref:hypothetical protein n=1 Tax=unclassified Nostoc TaxID=2593658 RepID=UPI0025CDB8FF|nr:MULTISPECIES: hypothetical protein [unclassified Nostoc]MBN3911138.1 hypothetical protein [Nostoc sp. NMS1]MBN3990214.1 hypothetical protein [Nostoc sp. NMS2]
MTTTLTDMGWTGTSSGFWTDGSNKVTDKIGGIVVNKGTKANTLSGKDSITGAGGVDTSKAGLTAIAPLYFGIENFGELIMGDGTDSIIGTATDDGDKLTSEFVYGIYNEQGSSITMSGNKNSITGTATGDAIGLPVPFGIFGIYNRSGTITMGDGNHNSITGIGKATVAIPDPGNGDIGFLAGGIFNRQGGTIAVENGNNNSITGIGGYYNGIYNRGSITIGNGNNNSISGKGISDGAYGIYNQNFALLGAPVSPASITIGDGNKNSITGTAEGIRSIGIFNESGCTITMGDGNKNSITGTAEGSGSIGIFNESGSTIAMGGGNDRLTGMGSIGIKNSGTIDMGSGNDEAIANGGFAGNGSVFLRAGNDYLKGFGSGNFDGGDGKDTLELTSGSYTVGLSGTTVTFTDSSNIIMTTSGFEKLIAGCTTYNFTSLSSGQTIVV